MSDSKNITRQWKYPKSFKLHQLWPNKLGMHHCVSVLLFILVCLFIYLFFSNLLIDTVFLRYYTGFIMRFKAVDAADDAGDCSPSLAKARPTGNHTRLTGGEVFPQGGEWLVYWRIVWGWKLLKYLLTLTLLLFIFELSSCSCSSFSSVFYVSGSDAVFWDCMHERANMCSHEQICATVCLLNLFTNTLCSKSPPSFSTNFFPLGRKPWFLYPSLLFPPACPSPVARQRPEESETPKRAAVSVSMATVWVIQVEVRGNSSFFLFQPPLIPPFLPPLLILSLLLSSFLSIAFIPPPFHFLSLCASGLPFFPPSLPFLLIPCYFISLWC